MNERELANKIKQNLNDGVNQLTGQVTERLKQSRQRALDAFAAQTVHENAYAFAGASGLARAHPAASRKWLPFALLSLVLIGVVYWQQEINHEDNIDAALLASEMPLNIFIDQNFHTWLDYSSQR